MIKIKRVYEPPSTGDGYRVLADRLWPRGLTKSEVDMDEWDKELAPSTELRKWFAHKREHWKEFRIRYLRELKTPEAEEKLQELAHRAERSTVTLLYAAREGKYNHTVILKSLIQKLMATNQR